MSINTLLSNSTILNELALVIQNSGKIANLRLAGYNNGSCPNFTATTTEQQKTFLTQSLTMVNGLNPIIVLFSFSPSTAGPSNYLVWFTCGGASSISSNTNSSTDIVASTTNSALLADSTPTTTKTLTIAITTISHTLTTTSSSSYSLLILEYLLAV